MAFLFVAWEMRFTKPAEALQCLLSQLTARGATINDQSKAYEVLSRIGYYRLSGYMIPFHKGHQPDPHHFKPGTTIEGILALYELDRKLRGLMMLAIEPIEVAFRSAMCNKLAKLHGPHWHTNSTLFTAGDWPKLEVGIAAALDFDLSSKARKVGTKQGRHLFIDHYYRKYTQPAMPPCWMLMEVASFGLVAKLFGALDKQRDLRAVASEFNFPDRKPIDEVVLSSWMHSLSVLRNRCAHHNRLVYQNLTFSPKRPTNSSVSHLFQAKNHKVREFLVTTAILTRAVNPRSDWVRKLYFLLDATSGVNIEAALGFSSPWESDRIWDMAWS